MKPIFQDTDTKHSPFDNHDSKSTSDFSGSVDGGFTVYQLHRTGRKYIPQTDMTGKGQGGYPEPQGQGIYTVTISKELLQKKDKHCSQPLFQTAG